MTPSFFSCVVLGLHSAHIVLMEYLFLSIPELTPCRCWLFLFLRFLFLLFFSFQECFPSSMFPQIVFDIWYAMKLFCWLTLSRFVCIYICMCMCVPLCLHSWYTIESIGRFFGVIVCLWGNVLYIYIYIYTHKNTHAYIYIYIYIYIRGTYDNFQTFFVWAFKIVVESWKFNMLLLYILWDYWSIFMISDSNEHQQ